MLCKYERGTSCPCRCPCRGTQGVAGTARTFPYSSYRTPCDAKAFRRELVGIAAFHETGSGVGGQHSDNPVGRWRAPSESHLRGRWLSILAQHDATATSGPYRYDIERAGGRVSHWRSSDRGELAADGAHRSLLPGGRCGRIVRARCRKRTPRRGRPALTSMHAAADESRDNGVGRKRAGVGRGRGSDRPFSGQTGRRWLAMSRKSVHLDSSSAGARMSASTFRGRALTLIPAGCKPRIEDMRARSSACLFRPVGRWRRLGVSVDLSLVSLWMQGGH